MSVVYYSFTVRGHYPNGNKATFSGHVSDLPGYPSSAFEKAIKACEDVTPGLSVNRESRNHCSLRQLKRKPR